MGHQSCGRLFVSVVRYVFGAEYVNPFVVGCIDTHQMKPVAFVDLTRTDDNNGMQEAASNTLELSSIANSRSDSSSAHVKNEGDSKLAPSPNRHVRRRDIYKLKDANNPITHSKAYEKTRE